MDDIAERARRKLMHMKVLTKLQPEARKQFIKEADDDLIKAVVGVTHAMSKKGGALSSDAKALLSSDTIDEAKQHLTAAGEGFFDWLGDAGGVIKDFVAPVVSTGMLLKNFLPV